MTKRVAVVTGANKGLGFGLVRALCPVFDGDVILTARDAERGKSAVQKLEDEGLHPKFHQLDVTDMKSINQLFKYIQENYKGLDLLVNNAGIMYPSDSTVPLSEQATETLKVNYFGLVDVTKVLLPLLRPQARVVNLSSRMGIHSFHKCSESLKKQFTDPSLTEPDLTAMMELFVRSSQENRTAEEGFPPESYGISKLGLIILSRIYQRQLEDQSRDSIIVNACTPGYVNTDMTRGKGTLSVEEGIVTPLYLCQISDSANSPRGAMLADKAEMDWEDPSHTR